MPDRYRSLLFVPGDSARKLAKAETAGADALILDLEDSVGIDARPAARAQVAEYLGHAKLRPCAMFVRINALQSEAALADLGAVMAGKPDGIMLPKALFAIGDYRRVGKRLGGLTWGAEDLATAIGAMANTDADGGWSQPFALARSLCLFAAASAGVAAIDTLYADFRDAQGLADATARSRRDGFAGRIAIHPDQVPIINAGFAPGVDEVAAARAIITLFAENPGAGVLSLDGAMLDAPHLAQAQRIVARHEQPRDGR